jgi:hypothetical protein
VGSLLVPPLIDGEGWRICLGSALFLAVLTVPASPMRPLLRLAADPGSSAATAAGLLAVTGPILIAVTTFLAARLR